MNRDAASSHLIPAAMIVIVAAAASVFLLGLVDRFAYLPDDGAYAYVAARLVAGDILHLHVQDVHLGYVNFANALALSVFGENLLALRYPLLILTVLQAILVFTLLARGGIVPAIVGAAAMSGLTFVQFLNPTAHWYSLFLTVLLAVVLGGDQRLSARRLLAAGVLVGLIFGFRQLSGVIVGLATLVIVLNRLAGERSSDQRTAALVALVPGTAVLALILSRVTDPGSAALFGVWPLAIMLVQIYRIRVADRVVLSSAGLLLTGFLTALLPLVVYHLWHGSLAIWWHDTVGAAISLSGMNFIASQSFTALPLLIVESVAASVTPSSVINGLFWLTLLLVPVALGSGLLRRWLNTATAPPVAIIASFYCLVSLHYQIPIYLLYSSALALVGLVCLAGQARFSLRASTTAVAALCVVVGIASHAARSPNDSLYSILRGDRDVTAIDCGLPRLKVRLTPASCNQTSAILRAVDQHASADDTLLALPVNPEIYFLSGRRSSLWFYNSALALLSDQDSQRALTLIEQNPPAMIFYRSDDKYHSERTAALMQAIKGRYIALPPMADFEVYRLADAHEKNTG